jgi:tripartite-type tricarboxylate transporter receptor subunit TctC
MIRVFFFLGAVLASFAALAQEIPPLLRIVVPFPPGGSNDVIARAIAPQLAKRLGNNVIVENKGGAAGVIGSDAVAKAPRDGSHLLLTSSTFVTTAATQAKLPYDPIAAFVPVAMVAEGPLLVAVPASMPIKSSAELLAAARAKPGALNYGATSSPTYLATELFTSMAGVKIVRIPFKGAAPAMTALMAGDVQLVLSGIGTMLPQVKSGRLKALAVTSAARSPLAPEIPTVVEAGGLDYVATTWYGLLAPAKTPRPIIERLNKESRALLDDPKVKEQLAPQGVVAMPSTPEEFGRFIRAEVAKWARVVQDTGATVD